MPSELVPPSLAAASSRDTCCVVYKTSPPGSSDPCETSLVEITGSYGHDDIFQWGEPRPLDNQAPSLSNPDDFAVSYDLSHTHVKTANSPVHSWFSHTKFLVFLAPPILRKTRGRSTRDPHREYDLGRLGNSCKIVVQQRYPSPSTQGFETRRWSVEARGTFVRC